MEDFYDNREFIPEVWFLEAENFRHDNNVNVVLQKDASNGKAIVVDGLILDKLSYGQTTPTEVYGPYLSQNIGLIPMLKFYNTNAFPIFTTGYEFQLFVRAKGPKDSFFCMEVRDSTTTFLSIYSSKYFLDREYRWFSSPKFTTSSMSLPKLWIQIFSTPPIPIPESEFFGLGCTFIDKLILIRTKDESNNPILHNYGQITDPLDPDTDLDGRNDGLESIPDTFWFEAEYWVQNYRIKDEELLASNSKAIKRIGGEGANKNDILDLNVLSPNFPSPYLRDGENYRLYFRARTDGASNDDKIETHINSVITQFILSNDYHWYMTPEFTSSSSVSILIKSSQESDVFLDKFMLIRTSNIIDGQLSDPLDPDIDWDRISEGDEISNDVYWVEGESKESGYSYPDVTSSNYFAHRFADTARYTLKVDDGIYQLYFKAKAYGDLNIDFYVTIPNTVIQSTNYILEPGYKWYSTKEFSFSGTKIYIDFTAQSSKHALLDKFMLVKRAEIERTTEIIYLNNENGPIFEDSTTYTADISEGDYILHFIAKAGGNFGSKNVNIVENQNPLSLNIVPKVASIFIDEIYNFVGINGEPPYSWSVDDPDVGIISDTGEFQPISEGPCTITLEDSLSNTATLDITVSSDQITGDQPIILPSGTIDAIYTGDSIQLGVTEGVPSYDWFIEPADIGKIDNTGLFTAYDEGTVTIQVVDETEISDVDLWLTIPSTNINNVNFILGPEFDSYITDKFSFTGDQISVQFTIEDPYFGKIEEIWLEKIEEIPSLSERPSGVVPTDPLDPDTDCDGRIDGYEYHTYLKWFEAEYYIVSGVVEIDTKANNKCIGKSSSGNLYSINIEVPAGEYQCLVYARNNEDCSGVKLTSQAYFSGCEETETQFLISDYNWYNVLTFTVEDSQTITLSGSCTIPSGKKIYVDQILLVRTKYGNGRDTGLKTGKLLGPNYLGIYRAKPGKISNALNHDSDGDSYLDSAEIKGITDTNTNKKYILDPLNTDTDGDNLLDNIETSSDTSYSDTNPTSADTDKDRLPDGWLDGWGYNLLSHRYEFGTKDDIKKAGIKENNFIYLEYEDSNRNGIIDKDTESPHYYIETNPNNDDTDSDDLLDNYELLYDVDPFDRDTDDDGIKDGSECHVFGKSLLFYPHLNMATAWDYDGDGLSDGQEIGKTDSDMVPYLNLDGIAGNDVKGTDCNIFKKDDDPTTETSPILKDTDHDGLPDGWIDYDEGGTDDYDLGEFEDKNLNGKRDNVPLWKIALDPSDPDYEASDWNMGGGPGETDPRNSNTDGDGVSDGLEVLVYETDPLDPRNNPTDSDSDGLHDCFEDDFVYDHSVIDWDASNTGIDYYTDLGPDGEPTDDYDPADTDSDGLTDGEERLSWPKNYEDYGSFELLLPLNPDCDQDGILDGSEKYGTGSVFDDDDGDGKINALDDDSDNDKLKDNEEAIVSFRANTKTYDESDVWIAVDSNDDGDLEGFGRDEGYSGTPSGSNLITTTPDGKEIYKLDSDSNRIYVFVAPDNKPVYSKDESEADSAILSIHPTHDYLFQETWVWDTDPTNPDSDDDGLSDYDEIKKYYTNPKSSDTDGDTVEDGVEVARGWDPNDPNGDSDGDGLFDIDEDINLNGIVDAGETDPNNADTDDDELPDGWETYYYYSDATIKFLNPTKDDSDDNGIPDGDETFDLKYDPIKDLYFYSDDFLSNYQEWFWETSPKNEDYDGDGYYDGVEIVELENLVGSSYVSEDIVNGIYYVSNPRSGSSIPGDVDGDTQDAIDNDCDSIDSDGDGYCNGQEARDYTDPYNEFNYPTGTPEPFGNWVDESSVGDNPPFDTEGIDLFDEDNDNDGLRNYDEINYDGDSIYTLGIDPDPLNPDTDGDGVLDGVEVHTDITDPLDPWDNLLDSDGDTINDYTELNTFYEKSEIDWDGDHSIDYCTNPNDADTDDDGCRDDWEIDGWSLKIFDHSTGYEVTSLSGDVSSNPLVRDMDGDGLLDGHEFMISDPTKEDTDGDHIKDNKEIQLKKLPTGVDNEPPKLTWSIQKIEENWLDGGLVNVKCSLGLDAIDYSGLEYVKIQVKTNGGSADTLESWSRGTSEPPQGCNIFATKKFYPINSYDVIFKAEDIDGHESWVEQHINSGWETFANMAAEAAQSVWNYVIGPIKDWALDQIESMLEPILNGFVNIEDPDSPEGIAQLNIFSLALVPAFMFAVPFLLTTIIDEDEISEIFASIILSTDSFAGYPTSWDAEVDMGFLILTAGLGIVDIVISCIFLVANPTNPGAWIGMIAINIIVGTALWWSIYQYCEEHGWIPL